MIPNVAQYLADNYGMVRTVAVRGHRRLSAIGASIDVEDLEQECAEVFIGCCDGFDEALGNKFSTYFYRAAYNRINRIASAFEGERIENGTHSVEEMDAHSDEGALAIERIASGDETPEQIASLQSDMAHLAAILTPLASTIVAWLVDPPEFLVREFEAQRSHALRETAAGGYGRSSREMSASWVMGAIVDLTGVNERVARAALAELRQVAKEVLA